VILLLAAIAGLALGSLAAFGIQLINRRIRHEEEMLRLYPLPVLARVPRLPRRHRRERLGGPSQSPPAMREAFRTLRLQIEQRESGRGTIMVTSGSAGDGKTTVVANLAFALAQGGYSVIALDLDVRKPQLGSALQVPESPGMTQLLTNRVGLASVLVDSPAAQGLRVLPAHERDAPLLESLLRRLPSLLVEAQALADYVILDTPPLGEVSDALTLASEVDTMLLVVRLGHTNRRRFEVARDLLERAGAARAGLVVIGDALEPSKAYYGHDDVTFLPVNAQAGPR
jgi:capsular exopolysaccharide synthesis family protein